MYIYILIVIYLAITHQPDMRYDLRLCLKKNRVDTFKCNFCMGKKPWENHDEPLPKSCFLLGLYVIPSVHQTKQLTITTENGHHCSPLYPFRGDFPSHGFHYRCSTHPQKIICHEPP